MTIVRSHLPSLFRTKSAVLPRMFPTSTVSLIFNSQYDNNYSPRYRLVAVARLAGFAAECVGASLRQGAASCRLPAAADKRTSVRQRLRAAEEMRV